MLAKQWLTNALEIMSRIEETQMEQIHQAAVIMADSIEAGRWVHKATVFAGGGFQQ